MDIRRIAGDTIDDCGDKAGMKAWAVPSIAMSAGLFFAAYLLMSYTSYSGGNLFSLWLWWILATLTSGLIVIFVETIKLAIRGVAQPTRALMEKFDRAYWVRTLGGPCLAGFNLVTFMWIKPELNTVAPFWADELLANVDRAILGRDAWTLFSGLNLPVLAYTYNLVWLLALTGVVFWLFHRPESRQRNTSIVAFFFLWSVFGPVGQYLMPAAGPIFYERIGLGGRFAELNGILPTVTIKVSDYLWEYFVNNQLSAGAGISAMPSLHIATAVWIIIVCHRTRLFWPSVFFGGYLFIGSMALGWHYAMDGIAGAAGALFAQWASQYLLFERRSKSLNLAHS